VLYAGGVILAMVAVFLTEESWPNKHRNHLFYIVSCASYPLYLVAVGRASNTRWGTTIAATIYMALNCGMLWFLPLFAGQPKLGPIYNPIRSFRAAGLPADPRGARGGYRSPQNGDRSRTRLGTRLGLLRGVRRGVHGHVCGDPG
jgi:hypothetical protein